MRVLYWMDSFSGTPGGIQRLGLEAMKALRERDFEFLVVCSTTDEDGPSEERRDGIRIRRVDMLRPLQEGDPVAMIRARREVASIRRDFEPHVVQVNFSGPTAVYHLDAPAPPVPTITALRISLPEGLGGENTLLGRLLRASDWVTANSRFVLRSALRAAPDIEDRASVIYNGLRPPGVRPAPPSASPPVVLGIGRLVPEKGFDVALEALARLSDDHPEVRLQVAGDGPERPALEARARELDIADRTEFLGWVPADRMPAAIDGSALVVVPSRWQEAFGLVVLEAAFRGRPVVASRVGGLPEVVEDGRTGLLVARDDPGELAGALGRLFDDPERRRRMGRAARKRALRRFTLDRYVEDYASLYRRVAEDGASAPRRYGAKRA